MKGNKGERMRRLKRRKRSKEKDKRKRIEGRNRRMLRNADGGAKEAGSRRYRNFTTIRMYSVNNSSLEPTICKVE